MHDRHDSAGGAIRLALEGDHAIASKLASLVRWPQPAWLPDLAPVVAAHAWSRVTDERGLARETYGLERFRAGGIATRRESLGEIRLGSAATAIVEQPTLSRAYYEELDLAFYARDEISPDHVVSRLNDAFAIVAAVPSLAGVVSSLLRTITPLRPPTPEYDVSHSDPEVPFSIFVSISPEPQRHGDLRLAEAIVHECMHLNLSLIEAFVPLVAGQDTLVYSPWKQAPRPPQGVLHGLYVFRCIDDFLAALLARRAWPVDAEDYLLSRRQEIREEMEQVVALQESSALTALGRDFVDGLMSATEQVIG